MPCKLLESLKEYGLIHMVGGDDDVVCHLAHAVDVGGIAVAACAAHGERRCRVQLTPTDILPAVETFSWALAVKREIRPQCI